MGAGAVIAGQGPGMTIFYESTGGELATLQSLLARRKPFTSAQARAAGATYATLRRWTGDGYLAHPLRGVYHAPDLPDSLELRLAVLRLVVPEGCVVTDRTAAWLWGAVMVLAPNDHLVTPAVHVFSPPGRRLRNALVSSGERALPASAVTTLDGVRVTTPLRTATDLGRLLHRDQALAAMDSLAALGRFTLDELAFSPLRFAGYRGVVQLRALVPLVDPRAQSPGESVLRLRWLDLGFPRPECQIDVPSPNGGLYHLDLGLREERFAAEYDGAAFHGDDREGPDEARRTWMREQYGWTIVVARSHHVHGPRRSIEEMLLEGRRQARKMR